MVSREDVQRFSLSVNTYQWDCCSAAGCFPWRAAAGGLDALWRRHAMSWI
jgi:hypothetical protein